MLRKNVEELFQNLRAVASEKKMDSGMQHDTFSFDSYSTSSSKDQRQRGDRNNSSNNNLSSDFYDPHLYASVRRKRRNVAATSSHTRQHRTAKNMNCDPNKRKKCKTNEDHGIISNNNSFRDNTKRTSSSFSVTHDHKDTYPTTSRGHIRESSDTFVQGYNNFYHGDSERGQQMNNNAFGQKKTEKSSTSHSRKIDEKNQEWGQKEYSFNTSNHINSAPSKLPRQEPPTEGSNMSTSKLQEFSSVAFISSQTSVGDFYRRLRTRQQDHKQPDNIDSAYAPHSSFLEIKRSTSRKSSHIALSLNKPTNIDHILNSIYNFMKNNDENNNISNLGRKHHDLTNILNSVQLHFQQSDSILEWLYGNNNDDSLFDLLIGTFEIMNHNNSQSDVSGHKFLLSEKFAELILLQIIDVIYSQRLPEVWFLISNNRCMKYAPMKKGTWDKITCLIRLMNQKIPILETACYVLVKHFKTQQWSKNILTGDYFVSSVTSEDCRNFFKTGELQTEGKFLDVVYLPSIFNHIK